MQDSSVSIKDFTYFYPVAPSHFDSLFDSTLQNESLFNNTYVIHLWNELLRRSNINKNEPFVTNSLVGYYFDKYCADY